MTSWVSYKLESGDGGENAPKWMAYVVMPNGKLWMVPSFAATEKEAVNKIVTLWESERAKVRVSDEQERQHHLAGLVWIINKNTREKKRVAADVAIELCAWGDWERGGPRSK